MTSNSIAYANLIETMRHNAEQERIKLAEIAESKRHNIQYESETSRHNQITESETQRSNVQNEKINRRRNTITDNYNTQQILLQGYNARTQRDHFVNLDQQAAINQSFNEWATQKGLYLQALRQEADQAHYERQDTIGFGQLGVSRKMAENDALKAKASMRSASAASTSASANMLNAFTQKAYSEGRLANETLVAGAQAENLYETGDAATLNAETQSKKVKYEHRDRKAANRTNQDSNRINEERVDLGRDELFWNNVFRAVEGVQNQERIGNDRQKNMINLIPFITAGFGG